IIENIIKTGYIARDNKKHLIPTDTAYTFVDLVTDKVKEPELTAEWEKQLSEINRGSMAAADFMNSITGFISSFVQDTKEKYSPEQSTGVFEREREDLGKCPKCGKKVVEFPKSYSCESGKGGCGFVIWKQIGGKAISKAQAKKLLDKGKTDLIKGFKSKTGKSYDAYLTLKEDKTIGFDFPERK
ncbi:MAG TPA: DNA topoisomerase III, partial [Clostridiales bacterium]|nr:DNA topoisomerase III [Clostridiales bacterium]